MKTIYSTAECMYKDLLALVSFGPQPKNSFFLHPRYAFEKGGVRPIEPSTFPSSGSIVITFGGATAADIRERYGDVVVVRFNKDELEESPKYAGPQDTKSSKYCEKLLQGKSVNPEIVITKLSSHSMSHDLMTIIELDEALDVDKPTERSFHLSNYPSVSEISTNLVIVRNGGLLYGPFEQSSVEDGKITLKGSSEYDYRVYTRVTLSNEDNIDLADIHGNRIAEFCLKKSFEDAIAAKRYQKQDDWISRERLHAIFVQAMRQSPEFANIGKNAFRRFARELSANDAALHDANLDDARKKRLLEMVSEVDCLIELPDEIRKVIMGGLDDRKLAEIVLAEENFPSFKNRIRGLPELQKEYDAERTRLNSQLEGTRKKIKEANAELQQVRKDEERIRENSKSYERKVLDASKEELEDLEFQCEVAREELAALGDQKSSLEKDIVSLETRMEDILSSLEDKARLSGDIIQSEMVRRAIAYANGASSAPQASMNHHFAVVSNSYEDDKELVEMLYDRVVESAGRSYNKNDLINFFICISQGYMTTFAGRPGTGKTSLCGLIADALGLTIGDSPRFAEISVERGWTSYRDYIGYYNPLSKTTEVSDPVVFEALRALTDEANGVSPDRVAPFLFLLDEANLSPIEHYWAPFLRACDSFARKPLRLSLGGGKPFLVPSHVRFLATVNYDHTTEELSPRYLDRSWVIMLDPDNIDSESVMRFVPDDGLATTEVHEAISYERLMRAFSPTRYDTVMDESIEESFGKILKVCSDYHHPISQRSQIMMRNYIAVASKLMEREATDDRLAPLDYAISQKVLPAIAGTAEQYDEYLQRLHEQCTALPLTHKRLEHIMEQGASAGYYQFFV